MTTTTDTKQQATSKPKVMVTGAAGGHMGATGRVLTNLLLQRGVPVRAFVRSDDKRAAALRAAGAEVVVGDLLNYGDVRRAAEGMDYIYFTFAVQDGLLEASTIAAIAAAEAGVKGVINNSQWCMDLQSLSPTARRHALVEAVFNAFPTPVVHLRGATYTMNIFSQLRPAIMDSGVLRAPGMEASDVLPLVSGTDIGAAADAVLKDFDFYAKEALLLVSQLHTLKDVAAEFSKIIGKEVTIETISIQTWEQEIRVILPGFNETGITHLGALWEIMREGSHDDELIKKLTAAKPLLETILGRKPITFSEDLSKFIQ